MNACRGRPWLLLLLAAAAAAQGEKGRSCPPEQQILPCRCRLRGDDMQIWCSHSDLPRVMEGLQAAAEHVTRVDEVIVENNHLPALPGRAFSPLKISRLMIRDNGLERISANTLAGLEDSLQELYIVEPRLRSFPFDAVDDMRLLEAFTLEGSNVRMMPRFIKLPQLRYIRVEGTEIDKLAPGLFHGLPKLEQIHIVKSLVTRLEAGLLTDLPQLTIANFTGSRVSWIHPRAFTLLPILRELSFSFNQIWDAGMVGRAVRELPSLAILHLDNNLIEMLPEASFVDIRGLQTLYLQNNQIFEIHRGAFDRLSFLRRLDLSGNDIARIHPQAFISIRALEEISLMENMLDHLGELRVLAESLPRLRFLDLSGNRIQEIHFGALRGHPTLERLHLNNNRIRRVQREAFTAMPALIELRLRNNSLSSFIEGPLWNLPNLKGLDLSQNGFKRVDGRLLSNLPSLRYLDLSRNAISTVDVGAFLGSPDLEQLNMSHNSIPSLHPNVFRNLNGLYDLDLCYNQLTTTPTGLFSGQVALEYLRLARNQIMELVPTAYPDRNMLKLLDMSGNGISFLPPRGLSSMIHLRKLRLGQNALHELETSSLDELRKLESLDLSDNRILHVGERVFKDLHELQELDLSGNRLEMVRPDFLLAMSRLQRIDLSHNQIAEVLPGALDHASELRVLNISHNSLKEMPVALHSLVSLEVLDMTNNRINKLERVSVKSMPSLAELRLSKNKLQKLEEGTFQNLPNLAMIDMDENDIEVISPRSIRSLPNLMALKLARNKLTVLPNNSFSQLNSLQAAELQENRIKHISMGAFNAVPRLLMLNLSHNQLPTLNRAGLHNLHSLEVLDLSNNKLANVGNNSFSKMEWLVELKMDDNRICGIQGSPFSGMPRLRVLSLRNNKMSMLEEPTFQPLKTNIAILDVTGNPLSCTCNLMWLRAWMDDSSQDIGDPRCSDGSSLRDMRFSRSDCQAKTLHVTSKGGCDAEYLHDGSGNTGLGSQVLTTQLVVKDGTPPPDAPSPEESDYFYDEYVDYQYYDDANHTRYEQINNTLPERAIAPTPTAHMPQLNSHYISGDTPTLYAATKPKNQSDVKKTMVDESKKTGSEGTKFSIFGFPIPNLNLGLWGNARTSDKAMPSNKLFLTPNLSSVGSIEKSSHNKAPSEQHVMPRRPDPIVNTNPHRTFPQPPNISFMANSKFDHSMHTHQQHQQPPPPQVPNRPILESGFVPIIPNSGGFIPIPNPTHHLLLSTSNGTNNEQDFTSGQLNPSASTPNISETVIPFNRAQITPVTPNKTYVKTNIQKLESVPSNELDSVAYPSNQPKSTSINQDKSGPRQHSNNFDSLPAPSTQPDATKFSYSVTDRPTAQPTAELDPRSPVPLLSNLFLDSIFGGDSSSTQTTSTLSSFLSELTTLRFTTPPPTQVPTFPPTTLWGDGSDFEKDPSTTFQPGFVDWKPERVPNHHPESKKNILHTTSTLRYPDDATEIPTVIPHSREQSSFFNDLWGMIVNGASEQPSDQSYSESTTSPPQVTSTTGPPTALSAFLVPGGQAPQSRPGKPTITKVSSPYPWLHSASTPIPDILQSPHPEEYLQGPVPGPIPPDPAPSASPGLNHNNTLDWYYKNYNQTNIEPYIGPGKKSDSQCLIPSVTFIISLLLSAYAVL